MQFYQTYYMIQNVPILAVDDGPKPSDIDLKESSVDDITDTTTPLLPAENDCIVIDNQVAIETQTDSDISYNQDISHNTSSIDEDIVIRNVQVEGTLSDSPSVRHATQSRRDILFPMRDQKSLEEIKQVIY